MSIVARINVLTNELRKVRCEFATFIADKNIPLDERYALWLSAPEDLKVTDDSHCSLDCLPSDFIMYDGPYHAERYSTVDMEDLISNAESGEYDGLDVDVNAVKEYVLQNNLKSFTYDW